MDFKKFLEKLKVADLQKELAKYQDKALKVIRDAEEFEELMIDLEKKCKSLPDINIPGVKIKIDMAKYVGDIFCLASLVRNYIINEYRDISKGCIVIVVCSLLYFLNPFDIIPDTFLGIGYLDDIAIVTFVLNTIDAELIEYKKWRDNKNQ